MEQFISTLLMIIAEEKKLEDVVPKRIKILQILESKKQIVMRIGTLWNLGLEDTKFMDDYWYYLGSLNQIITRWQEIRIKVDTLNDKITNFLNQEDFIMKLLDDDNSIREVDLVTTKVRHLIHSLIMIEDVNSYQNGSHFESMMKVHTQKSMMLDFMYEVNKIVESNQPRFREILHGLEHTDRFITYFFKEHVDDLDPLDAQLFYLHLQKLLFIYYLIL